VTPVAAQLEALHPQFASVDSLPLVGPPLTTIPWILVALGAGLIRLGVVIWRTRGRAPLICPAGLGLAMVVLPLALSYPRKASDAGKVAAVGRVALSQQAATGAHTANRLIDNMVTQVDTQMIPVLAQRLRLTAAALGTSLRPSIPRSPRGSRARGVAVDQARRRRTRSTLGRQCERRGPLP
jgi:hypothetical protein